MRRRSGPPTGIALASFLRFGYHLWPGIFIGAFLVNITTAGSVISSIGIAAGNTLEGLIGAYLVNRFANGKNAFDRPHDIFKFVFLAGIVSTTISATFGATSLFLNGYASWANYSSIWITWWLGDFGGALIIAPLLLSWMKRLEGFRLRFRFRFRWHLNQRVMETVLLTLSLFIVGQAVFGGWLPISVKNYPFSFLPVPILVWIAYRLGQGETTMAIFLLSGFAIWGTLHGFGPFAIGAKNESLLLLQVFMSVEAMMAMTLTATVLEKKRVEKALFVSRHEVELSRLRSEFITMVSHELKSPISGLRLLLERISSGRLHNPQKTKEYYDAVSRELDRLERFVNRFLELHKIQTGHREYQFTSVSIIELAETVISHLLPQAEAKGIRLEAQVEGDIPQIDLDESAISNALENLIDNAIKYSPPDTCVTVAIQVINNNDNNDNNEVCIEVSDQGVGIDPDELPFIFDKFYRGILGEQYSVKGSGIGLSLVKAIIEAHGGRIKVTSVPGKGSGFSLLLPTNQSQNQMELNNGAYFDS